MSMAIILEALKSIGSFARTRIGSVLIAFLLGVGVGMVYNHHVIAVAKAQAVTLQAYADSLAEPLKADTIAMRSLRTALIQWQHTRAAVEDSLQQVRHQLEVERAVHRERLASAQARVDSLTKGDTVVHNAIVAERVQSAAEKADLVQQLHVVTTQLTAANLLIQRQDSVLSRDAAVQEELRVALAASQKANASWRQAAHGTSVLTKVLYVAGGIGAGWAAKSALSGG